LAELIGEDVGIPTGAFSPELDAALRRRVPSRIVKAKNVVGNAAVIMLHCV
jgi:hypothetical protein